MCDYLCEGGLGIQKTPAPPSSQKYFPTTSAAAV